jgi:hypothetical protein
MFGDNTLDELEAEREARNWTIKISDVWILSQFIFSEVAERVPVSVEM